MDEETLMALSRTQSLDQEAGSADTERMASMMVLILSDVSLEDAIANGAVKGDEEEEVWKELVEEIIEIQSQGLQVEIPVDSWT